MSTAAARLTEKAICVILARGVTGSPEEPMTFVPQKGMDPSTTAPAPLLNLPLGVVAVMPGEGTREVIYGSGVYEMNCRLVVMSEMDDDSVTVHEATLRQCDDWLRQQQYPQAFVDDQDNSDRITISGIDVIGLPVNVDDPKGQARCDVFTLAVACGTGISNMTPNIISQTPGPVENIVTTGIVPPYTTGVVTNGSLGFWQLNAQTYADALASAAGNADLVKQPADYIPANPKTWVKVL